MTENPNDLEAKRREYFQATGVMLMETQRIERFLKEILVLIKYEGKFGFAEELRSHQEFVQKKTIGLLLKCLKDKSTMSDLVENQFDDFLDTRNIFIHHLLDIRDFNLDSVLGIETGLVFLREYQKNILLIESFLLPITIGILLSYLKNFWKHDLSNDLKFLVVSLRERLDVVNTTLAAKFGIKAAVTHWEISEEDSDYHEYLKLQSILEAVNEKNLHELDLGE